MNESDKKLLERAAKALGDPKLRWNGAIWVNHNRVGHTDARGRDWPAEWNPLADDGDALRLLVKLNMHFQAHQSVYGSMAFDYIVAGIENPEHHVYIDPEESKWLAEEDGQPDRNAAARRAIVRAAAEIGKQLS